MSFKNITLHRRFKIARSTPGKEIQHFAPLKLKKKHIQFLLLLCMYKVSLKKFEMKNSSYVFWSVPILAIIALRQMVNK